MLLLFLQQTPMDSSSAENGKYRAGKQVGKWARAACQTPQGSESANCGLQTIRGMPIYIYFVWKERNAAHFSHEVPSEENVVRARLQKSRSSVGNANPKYGVLPTE